MEPFAWAGAGSAPYYNVIGLDPQLMDPESGDYRPAPGSPAVAYGCQTFARPARPPRGAEALPDTPGNRQRRDVIEVPGTIAADTTWNADLVRVVGDVTVKDGVVLTITPPARVEFQDYYCLAVAGTLLAVGTPDARIVFTTDQPDQFRIDESHTGCWNGVRFDQTAATNVPSRLAYCVLEYSKATGGGAGPHPYGGGAVSVCGFSGLTIENCIFRNNVADYGGACFLYRQANVALVGNLIVGNHALQNAGAVYCAYSYPQIVNNTIVGNAIHNEQNPYIESCAVLNFIAKPVLTNNIIRDNDPGIVYMHSQLWENKAYYTHYNNIEDYPAVGGNIDADPDFVDPALDDYHLAPGSPCVDSGSNTSVPLGNRDLDGCPRVVRSAVDMGAYEVPFGDVNCDGRIDFGDINPFVLYLSNFAGWQAVFPDCAPEIGDVNGDGTYGAGSFGDINPFVARLTSP